MAEKKIQQIIREKLEKEDKKVIKNLEIKIFICSILIFIALFFFFGRLWNVAGDLSFEMSYRNYLIRDRILADPTARVDPILHFPFSLNIMGGVCFFLLLFLLYYLIKLQMKIKYFDKPKDINT